METRYFPITAPRRLYRSPAMGRALRSVLSSGAAGRRFDLVHLHSIFLWPTSAAARVAEGAGVPYVVAPRGMLVPALFAEHGRLRKGLWLRLVEGRTLRRAAAIHATTDLEAKEAAAFGLGLPPVRVVPNGIDLEAWDRPASAEAGGAVAALLADGAPYVLFLGRLSWKKGIDRLLGALTELPEPCRLVVAGPDEGGYRRALESLAETSGLAARVRFLGPVRGADKVALVQGAIALALPSRSENFANVVLEAMAAGTPVLVTPEVGLAGVVEAAGAGLVVAGEAEAIGRGLAELAEDPARRQEMGRRGRIEARRFAWPAVAEAMTAMYREVAGAR